MGQMCSGGGHVHLKETASVLGIPTMTKKPFVAAESATNKCWWQSHNVSIRKLQGRKEVSNRERVLS